MIEIPDMVMVEIRKRKLFARPAARQGSVAILDWTMQLYIAKVRGFMELQTGNRFLYSTI
jgi:hypothetical protein